MRHTIVIGTRPELIKLAPVVHTLRNAGEETRVLFTGQDPRSMLEPLMSFFDLYPDVEIPAREPKGALSELSAGLLSELEDRSRDLESDNFIVQGNSASAFISGYFAFSHKIPISHVEAGLRTHDLNSPFPGEGHRQMLSRIAKHHFAPTFQAARFLMKEGVSREHLAVVGNTGIDALLFAQKKLEVIEAKLLAKLPRSLCKLIETDNLVLVTVHREENQGENLQQICHNLLRLARCYPRMNLLIPMHPNPQARSILQEELGDEKNIFLTDPLPYLSFIYVMSKSRLIITDSGAIQEEAPTLRVPVLVLREKTERQEAVAAGFAKLVGVDGDLLIHETTLALRNGCEGLGVNPFGDGLASRRIVRHLVKPADVKKREPLKIVPGKREAELGQLIHLPT